MTKSPFDIAWEVVFRRFFCPETELFYDYVIDDQSNAWHHLPLPDDIKANVPNPCGWGTGMEDSALNGGSALDALVLAYEKTGDPRIKTYTDAIRAVARKWGIPYLDIPGDYAVPLMNRVSERDEVCDLARKLRFDRFSVSENNRHPNARAHEFESTFIEHWLRSL